MARFIHYSERGGGRLRGKISDKKEEFPFSMSRGFSLFSHRLCLGISPFPEKHMAAFIKDVIIQGGRGGQEKIDVCRRGGGRGQAKIDVCRRGGGRGQAKIDVFNFCFIISRFEAIYDEFSL